MKMFSLLLFTACIFCSICLVCSFTGSAPQRFASKLMTTVRDDDIRTFTSYPIYKSKSAMCVKIIPPTFEMVGPRTRTLSREGVLLLEFANAVPGAVRAYDWAHKLTFSLSSTECGQFLVGDPKQPIEFFHDPNMKGPEAGKISKKLKIFPTDQANGCFLSLTVSDKSGATPTSSSITIPAAWSEIEVMRSIVSYCIPRFLGLNSIWNDAGVPFDHTAVVPAAPGPHSGAPISTFDEDPSAATPVVPTSTAAASPSPAAATFTKKRWTK